MEQVAGIWVDGSDIKLYRSIMLHGKSSEPCYIRAYYGCYDPLAYPFFYPGETGWKDKKVLLEELPVKLFATVKRKYTSIFFICIGIVPFPIPNWISIYTIYKFVILFYLNNIYY